MLKFLDCTDFYKTGHHAQIEPGTTRILENFTARAGRDPTSTGTMFIGLDAHLKYDLTDLANDTFFSVSKQEVIDDYKMMMGAGIGPNGLEWRHIAALHDLQYLPLEYCALPEGTFVPYKVPMFTVENTHDEFPWVQGYLETLTSCRVWQCMTSATTARQFRRTFEKYAKQTGAPERLIDWQGHDFSMRGMGSPEAAAMSGMGHLLFFKGTDTRPAIRLIRNVYRGDVKDIGGSVVATEHMVMCLPGKEREKDTIERILDVYPTGIVSEVMDTWDLWNVIDQILPQLKDKIMARDGKLVVRPDSGDPVLILTGDPSKQGSARKGVVKALWDQFGGLVNKSKYYELDPHIGAIYGDSIDLRRQEQILDNLLSQNFASSNVVLGIGSYSYQYVTRDTHGIAIKATWAKVNGEERKIWKDPVTDSGTKKSARGRLVVIKRDDRLQLVDDLSLEQETWFSLSTWLKSVWRNGRFVARNRWDYMKARAMTELWLE